MGKRNNIRQVLAAGIIIIVVSLAISLYMKLPGFMKRTPAVSRLPQNIDISLKTVRYSESRNGVTKWVLDARQADVEQKINLIHLTEPRFVVYLERKPGTVTITAGRAAYNIKTKDVVLNDTVVGVSDGGMRVQTENLSYREATSLLTTRAHIVMTHPGGSIEGDGLEMNSVTGTIRLLSRVSATLQPDMRKE